MLTGLAPGPHRRVVEEFGADRRALSPSTSGSPPRMPRRGHRPRNYDAGVACSRRSFRLDGAAAFPPAADPGRDRCGARRGAAARHQLPPVPGPGSWIAADRLIRPSAPADRGGGARTRVAASTPSLDGRGGGRASTSPRSRSVAEARWRCCRSGHAVSTRSSRRLDCGRSRRAAPSRWAPKPQNRTRSALTIERPPRHRAALLTPLTGPETLLTRVFTVRRGHPQRPRDSRRIAFIARCPTLSGHSWRAETGALAAGRRISALLSAICSARPHTSPRRSSAPGRTATASVRSVTILSTECMTPAQSRPAQSTPTISTSADRIVAASVHAVP